MSAEGDGHIYDDVDLDRACKVSDAVKRVVEMCQKEKCDDELISIAANVLGYVMVTCKIDSDELLDFVEYTLDAYEEDPAGKGGTIATVADIVPTLDGSLN